MGQKNFFRAVKGKNDVVINYKVGEVSFITHCSEDDVQRYRNEYNRQRNYKQEIVESNYVPREKKIDRAVDVAELFYHSLVDTDYFLIDSFTIKLFDEKNVQYYLQDGTAENFVAGFFLTNKKMDLSSNSFIKFFKYKKVDNYYVLLVLPKIKFRDNRFAFFIPKYGKEISYQEAKRCWSSIDQYGFQTTMMPLKNIQKTRKARSSILDKIEKAKAIELKKNIRELRKIGLNKTIKVDNESYPFITGKKSFKKVIDWERVQRDMDRLLRSMNIYT